MLVAPTATIASYGSTSALRAEHHILLFCISFMEHCVFTLLSFFKITFLWGLADYIQLSEGATALAELDVLLPLLSCQHFFVVDVGLSPVLQGSQFVFKEIYFAYCRSRGVHWEDKAYCK